LFSYTGIQKVVACEVGNSNWQSMDDSSATLRSTDGKRYQLLIKIAKSSDQHRVGFQHICSKLIQKWGMLFIFSTLQRTPFHMDNVEEDLDIAFFAEDGELLELAKMNRDNDSHAHDIYRARQPFSYALEVGGNQLFSMGMNKGHWWLVVDPSW
jgi:uncharacterized membrane protein (UPF0127 family)